MITPPDHPLKSLLGSAQKVEAEPIKRATVDLLESFLGQRVAQAVKVEASMRSVFCRPVAAVPGIAGIVDQQQPAAASEHSRCLAETQATPALRRHVHHRRDRDDVEPIGLERQLSRVGVLKRDIEACAAGLAARGATLARLGRSSRYARSRPRATSSSNRSQTRGKSMPLFASALPVSVPAVSADGSFPAADLA